MEKLIVFIKYIYLLLSIIGWLFFASRVILVSGSNRSLVTPANFISALIIVILIWGIISSVFLLAIGIIRRISAKGDKYKLKVAKQQIIKAIILLLILFFVWFAINLISIFYGMDIPAFTAKHFRTNIFTGVCNYGGDSHQIEGNPWYYKPDCKIDKKIEIAKKEGFFDERVNECNQYCTDLRKNYFCNTYIITVGDAWGNGPENLLCKEIVNCPQIDCVAHENDRQSQEKEAF